MNFRVKKKFLAVLLLPSLAAPWAHADSALQQRLSPAAEKIFHDSKAPEMLIAVVQGKQQFIQGFGANRDGSKPGAESLVRIDSLSKLFAAELMAILANDGKLALNDTLQRHAPPHSVVPRSGDGREITLLQLATHTSGLPHGAGGEPPANAVPFT